MEYSAVDQKWDNPVGGTFSVGIFFPLLMIDELKFRAWDQRLGKFSYFGLRGVWGHLPVDIPSCHIHQWIGLFDSSGKDVYVGDIVRFDNSEWSEVVVKGIGEVVFCRDLLIVDSPSYGLHFKDGFHSSFQGHFEVIGNAFENSKV